MIEDAVASPVSVATPTNGKVRVFDEHHPPSADLLNVCVHCGFCLQTCPTYTLWGKEMDSPRGRIHLIGMAIEGEVGLTICTCRTSITAWDARPA